ncbi:MAG TPA: threonine/serine exporter family protein [Candidatus Avisuccinivibrio pullicola]|nr:threonine/serine exporter family protein [Candidatus Avisuccinivibrio pullicola]
MEHYLITLTLESLAAAFIGPAFAMLFGVPLRYLSFIAVGSALTRFVRQGLYTGLNLDVIAATFIACALLSLIFIYIAPRLNTPRPLFTVPCVISLMPGMDAYKALLALISLMRSDDREVILGNIITLFHCGMRSAAIVLAMCLGIAVVPLFFYRYRHHHL